MGYIIGIAIIAALIYFLIRKLKRAYLLASERTHRVVEAQLNGEENPLASEQDECSCKWVN